MNGKDLERDEAAWEAWLAEGWRAAAEPEAGTEEESAAFARRLDGMLRRERAERRAWRARWMRWGAAAACAAVLAGASWWGLAGRNGGPAELAEASETEETTLAEAREAPVEEEFAGLEEMLTVLASADIGYEWADETWAD